MDGTLIILGLVVGLFVAVAPILAWVAIFQIQSRGRDLSPGCRLGRGGDIRRIDYHDPWQLGFGCFGEKGWSSFLEDGADKPGN